MTLERIIHFRPAFDKRSPDKSKDYGIHGMEITFVLKGAEGAVQWKIHTNWQLPHVQREMRAWRHDYDARFDKIYPEGYDLGYHSRTPHYEGQRPISKTKCDILDGECYYDGSGLNAEPLVEPFLREGDAAVWRELTAYYEQVFTPAPATTEEAR